MVFSLVVCFSFHAVVEVFERFENKGLLSNVLTRVKSFTLMLSLLGTLQRKGEGRSGLGQLKNRNLSCV